MIVTSGVFVKPQLLLCIHAARAWKQHKIYIPCSMYHSIKVSCIDNLRFIQIHFFSFFMVHSHMFKVVFLYIIGLIFISCVFELWRDHVVLVGKLEFGSQNSDKRWSWESIQTKLWCWSQRKTFEDLGMLLVYHHRHCGRITLHFNKRKSLLQWHALVLHGL